MVPNLSRQVRISFLCRIMLLSEPWAVGGSVSLAPEDARRRVEETLKVNAARPLFTGTAVSFALWKLDQLPTSISKKPRKFCPTSIPPGLIPVAEVFYRSTEASICCLLGLQGMIMRLVLAIRFLQPASCFLQDYEEVVIPPAKTVPPRGSERLIPVSELDELARGSFPVKRPHASKSKLAELQTH